MKFLRGLDALITFAQGKSTSLQKPLAPLVHKIPNNQFIEPFQRRDLDKKTGKISP